MKAQAVRVFGAGGGQLRMVLFEAIGNVLEEDEAEDGMLILPRYARPPGSLRLAISASLRFCRVHGAAELVGSEPELRFKAEVGGGVVLTIAGASRHSGVAVLSVGIGKSKGATALQQDCRSPATQRFNLAHPAGVPALRFGRADTLREIPRRASPASG